MSDRISDMVHKFNICIDGRGHVYFIQLMSDDEIVIRQVNDTNEKVLSIFICLSVAPSHYTLLNI